MKRRLGLALRWMIAAGLLAYVVSRVSFEDQVVLEPIAEGQPIAIAEPQDRVLDWAREQREVRVDHADDRIWLRPLAEDGGRQGTTLVERPPLELRASQFDRAVTFAAGRLRLEPGLLSLLQQPRPLWLAAAVSSLLAATLIAILRWTLLLRAQGVEIRYGEAARLSFVGLFFNHLVPGSVGGDVLKAVFVSKRTEKKTAAILSILADRLCGLAAVLSIAAVSVLLAFERFEEIAFLIYGLLGAGTVGAVLLLSPRARNAFGLSALLRRLPGQSILQGIDEAITVYSAKKRTLAGAFVLSLLNHLGVIGAYLCIGIALGSRIETVSYFVSVPIIDLASAIPLAPGGWGTGEAAAVHVLGLAGMLEARALALSVLYRLTALSLSLPGGLILAASRFRGEETAESRAPAGAR